MSKPSSRTRIDSASRVILAPPRTLFRAFIDAEAMAAWRAPDGMTARILAFDPRVGGGYRMLLRHDAPTSPVEGKTRPGEDEVEVRFVELLAHERIIEDVTFLSDDPAFAGTMTLTTLFQPDRDGTKVTLEATGVPPGIAPEDHRLGMAASLRNLARLTE